MGEEESELLRTFRAGYEQTHEAFNRQDLEAAFGGLPEDVEWSTIQAIPGAPEVCRGRDEVIAFFRDILHEFPDWHTDLDRFSEPLPGVLVVEFTAHATGRTSGIAIDGSMVQVWDLRERPVQVREFTDLGAARGVYGWPAPGS